METKKWQKLLYENKLNEETTVLLFEGKASKNFEVSLKNLINNVKNGIDIDTRMLEKHSDGELLAMILTPLFQSELNHLADRKGFVRNFSI